MVENQDHFDNRNFRRSYDVEVTWIWNKCLATPATQNEAPKRVIFMPEHPLKLE